MEGIRKAMNERNQHEGQWEDRKQWNLGVGQRGERSETGLYIYICLSMNYLIRDSIYMAKHATMWNEEIHVL
jgi:hypothetical protein